VSTLGRISIANDTSQTTGNGQVYVDGGTLYIGAGGIATPAEPVRARNLHLQRQAGGSGFLPGLTVAGASNLAMLGGTQFTGDGILGAAGELELGGEDGSWREHYRANGRRRRTAHDITLERNLFQAPAEWSNTGGGIADALGQQHLFRSDGGERGDAGGDRLGEFGDHPEQRQCGGSRHKWDGGEP